MGIDKEKIIQRISDIQSNICYLEQYGNIDENEFLKDNEKIAASKYYLIAVIEGCISLCTHISVKEFHKVPDAYAACFKILADNNILSKTLANNLSKMVGFRNLLIHRYWEIDDRRVYRYIKSDIVKIVTEYLKIMKDRFLNK
jgi:uncharacterized protein YutE (UPF0331/DUF86 family)